MRVYVCVCVGGGGGGAGGGGGFLNLLLTDVIAHLK